MSLQNSRVAAVLQKNTVSEVLRGAAVGSCIIRHQPRGGRTVNERGYGKP